MTRLGMEWEWGGCGMEWELSPSMTTPGGPGVEGNWNGNGVGLEWEQGRDK